MSSGAGRVSARGGVVTLGRLRDHEHDCEPFPGTAPALVPRPAVRAANSVVSRVLAPGVFRGLSGEVAAGIVAEHGRGNALADPMLTEMSAAFGTDFSRVRVHDDPQAARLSRAVGAQAFTSGSDIYLADPADGRDRELIAHELTHVVQQSAVPHGVHRTASSDDGPTRVSDPAEPAEAEARHIARAVIDLGRTGGNRVVVRRLDSGVVQRSTTDATTVDQVKEIRSFEGADDNEKLRLMNILLGQWWVGSSDEAALERIWNSFTEEGMVRFCDKYPTKFTECFNRGADLLDAIPYKAILKHFTTDIVRLAQHYLGVNDKVVQQELETLGAGAPPKPAQVERIVELQEAAAVLASLQRAQEAATHVAVGWRIGDGGDVDADWTGRQVTYEVMFKPGEPPPLTAEPPDLPSGDLFVHRKAAYAEVMAKYDAATQSIADLVEANPSLSGLVRGGNGARTNDFVSTADPVAAREKLTAPLRKVLSDIAATRALLGGDLNPLDLQPLVDQLFAGGAAVGGNDWTSGFRQHAARNALVGHSIDKAFTRAVTQEVQALALMFAPLTSGVWLLLALSASATAAGWQGWQAFGSYKEAKAMEVAEGSSVKPGTELVPPGSAEQARITAEADQAATLLAVLVLGTEGIAAWRAGRIQPSVRSAPPNARISSGAFTPNPERQVVDPFSGEVLGERSASAQTARSLNTAIRADVGEAAAWRGALERGEIGLKGPTGANVSGGDFFTARVDPGGQVTLIANDVKTSTVGKFPVPATTIKPTWTAELRAAIQPERLKLGDAALEDAIRSAFDSGRVRIRQLNVDFSTAGGGVITGY